MKEKWVVTLHLELDKEKNPCDPPGRWNYRVLLDLHPDESVKVNAVPYHEGGLN